MEQYCCLHSVFFVELVKFTQILALAHMFSFVVSKHELYCSTIFIYVHVTLVPNQSCEVKQYQIEAELHKKPQYLLMELDDYYAANYIRR